MARVNYWWQGSDSLFNDRAMDFILATHGLSQAVRRFVESQEDIHVAIECSWWIGAATEACGRRSDGSILEAFYWVRNKGIHATAKALGQVIPGHWTGPLGISSVGLGVLGGRSVPTTWAQLDGSDEGSRKMYNQHLASRSVGETIDEAFACLLEEFEKLRSESGVKDLPHLDDE